MDSDDSTPKLFPMVPSNEKTSPKSPKRKNPKSSSTKQREAASSAPAVDLADDATHEPHAATENLEKTQDELESSIGQDVHDASPRSSSTIDEHRNLAESAAAWRDQIAAASQLNSAANAPALLDAADWRIGMRWTAAALQPQVTQSSLWQNWIAGEIGASQIDAAAMDSLLQVLEDYSGRLESAALSVAFLAQLPQLSQEVSDSQWAAAFQQIAAQASQATSTAAGPIVELILGCEVPLWLALRFGPQAFDFPAPSDLMDRVSLWLEQAAETPSGVLTQAGRYLPAAVAALVRCRAIADQLELKPWRKAQRDALAELAILSTRFRRTGGGWTLVEATESLKPAAEKPMWKQILEYSGNNSVLETLIGLRCGVPGDRKIAKRSMADFELPEVSYYDATAKFALFQKAWSSKGSRMIVDFSESTLKLEVAGNRGKLLFSGYHTCLVKKNGKVLQPTTPWTEVCWFTDDDVDYLEVEARFGGECTIQRQYLLVREDGLLFFADALLSTEEAQWSVASHMPLSFPITFAPQSDSREGYLVTNPADTSTREAVVIPLALPEWKRQLGSGNITLTDDQLSIEHNTRRSRMFAPIMLGLKRSMQQQVLTWRQLTVAELLDIKGPDVAAGYRLQIAAEQWLIYRTLAPARRRTVLGAHLGCDFYVGRFNADEGISDAVITVNAEESD